MAHRYEFGAAAASDLENLTRRNTPLPIAIVTEHIPRILENPYAAGEQKRGNLSHVRGYGFTVRRVAYRLIYTVADDLVTLVACGTHDEAYERAARHR